MSTETRILIYALLFVGVLAIIHDCSQMANAQSQSVPEFCPGGLIITFSCNSTTLTPTTTSTAAATTTSTANATTTTVASATTTTANGLTLCVFYPFGFSGVPIPGATADCNVAQSAQICAEQCNYVTPLSPPTTTSTNTGTTSTTVSGATTSTSSNGLCPPGYTPSGFGPCIPNS